MIFINILQSLSAVLRVVGFIFMSFIFLSPFLIGGVILILAVILMAMLRIVARYQSLKVIGSMVILILWLCVFRKMMLLVS